MKPLPPKSGNDAALIEFAYRVLEAMEGEGDDAAQRCTFIADDAVLLGLATRREDSDESEDPWITVLAPGKR